MGWTPLQLHSAAKDSPSLPPSVPAFSLTHSLSLLNPNQHGISLFIFLLILLKLLLALGQQHSTEVCGSRPPILSHTLHLDGGQHLAEVGIGNAEVWLLQSLQGEREGGKEEYKILQSQWKKMEMM